MNNYREKDTSHYSSRVDWAEAQEYQENPAHDIYHYYCPNDSCPAALEDVDADYEAGQVFSSRIGWTERHLTDELCWLSYSERACSQCSSIGTFYLPGFDNDPGCSLTLV